MQMTKSGTEVSSHSDSSSSVTRQMNSDRDNATSPSDTIVDLAAKTSSAVDSNFPADQTSDVSIPISPIPSRRSSVDASSSPLPPAAILPLPVTHPAHGVLATPVPAPAPHNPLPSNMTTVGHLINSSHHLRSLPPAILRQPHETVADSDRVAHSVMQLAGLIGIPASAIPLIIHDWKTFLIGTGLGALAGTVSRFTSSTPINPSVSEIYHWLSRTASMNTSGQLSVGGPYSLGILGNFLGTMYSGGENQYFVLAEGAAVGAILGSEATGLLMTLIRQGFFNNSSSQHPSQPQPHNSSAIMDSSTVVIP